MRNRTERPSRTTGGPRRGDARRTHQRARSGPIRGGSGQPVARSPITSAARKLSSFRVIRTIQRPCGGPTSDWNDSSGKRQNPLEMAIPPLRFLVGFAQAIERVLTNRLQHPIASRSLVLLGEDEVLVRQRCEQGDGVRFLDAVSRTDVLRRRQRPAIGEDGHSTHRSSRSNPRLSPACGRYSTSGGPLVLHHVPRDRSGRRIAPAPNPLRRSDRAPVAPPSVPPGR